MMAITSARPTVASAAATAMAAQPVIDGVRRAPPLADGLDHGGGSRAHVARGEDLWQTGAEDVVLADQRAAAADLQLGLDLLRLGLDPRQLRPLADGAQHGVALDHELGAGHRLRAATALLIGRTELHADLFPQVPAIVKTLPDPIDQMKLFELIQIVPAPTRSAMASGNLLGYRVSDPKIMASL